MNSLDRGKNKVLDLEHDIPTDSKDVDALRKSTSEMGTQDLGEYIEFLEDIGAFETKKIKKHFFEDEFEI